MKGALWQDGFASPWWRLQLKIFASRETQRHGGWTEIHPVDWIVRVDEPKPAYRKTVDGRCADPGNTSVPFDLTPTAPAYPPTRRYTVGENAN